MKWYYIYVEIPKNPWKKLQELINEVSKVAEYKINIHTSVTFLYANLNYQKENAKIAAKKQSL